MWSLLISVWGNLVFSFPVFYADFCERFEKGGQKLGGFFGSKCGVLK
jgi:hypothetical protein